MITAALNTSFSRGVEVGILATIAFALWTFMFLVWGFKMGQESKEKELKKEQAKP